MNEHRQKKYANLLSELINRGEFLSGNLKENLMNITEIASIMLDTERVGIWRYSEDYSLLHCYDLFESGKNKHSEGYKLNSSEFPDYTQSHKIGEVIAAEDVFTDNRTSHIPAEYFKSNGIKSLLDAPVWVEGKLTAVLSFEQTGEPRKWLPEEIQISLTLSSYVSMCIESYERKKIEKAIASSEANLKEAQRIAKLGRWELDLVNDKLEWTDSIYEIFELGKKEFGATYEAFLDAVHPEDRNAVNTAYRKSLADKTPYEITHRLLMKDGRIKWVKEICRSEFDNEGMPLRSIGIVQDITDIMTAEKSLRESEEKFRTFVETMPEGYYQSTPSGKFIYVNPALAKLLGYEDREELMKVDIPSQLYFKPEEREVLYKNVDFTGDFEIYRLKRKDSTEVWIEDHSRYIRDEKGKVKYHEGICRDITKRLEYEDRIRKLNRVYAVLSSINQTIVRTHDIKELFDEVCRIAVDEGKFRMAFIGIKNTKEQKIDIVSRHGYINGYFDNTVLSINEDSEPVGPSAITIINGENIICNDIENDMLMKRWKKEALKRKYYSKASFPLKVFGKIYGVISIYSDIRNFFDKDEIELLDDLSRDISFAIESIYNEEVRRNAETELIKAKEKAEEMNRVKTNFLANMSHEIRTPMVAILGFSEYMAETAKEKDLRESAEKVYEGGKRLMETLDMILNISLIESQKVNIELTDVDIIKEIREATSFFEITAKNKNLYLKTETEFENLYLRLDSRIFRHILNNLINNGVKYSGTGGITIKVTKEKRNKEKYAVIRVIDTGIGIPADKQDLIWEEFRQVSEGWGRQFEGSGLGLAITKQFVQKLGGEIYVEKSIPGKGSTFMMLFHYDESIQERLKSEEIETAEIPADIPVSEPYESLPEILYVENEEDSISLVKLILRNICKIDTAFTGEEAIKKAEVNKYPTIIMDINLGKGMDGLRATEIIKQIPGYKDTPVIALTAYAMAEERKKFLSKGCTHYVSKPFRKNEFIKLISQVLKKG